MFVFPYIKSSIVFFLGYALYLMACYVSQSLFRAHGNKEETGGWGVKGGGKVRGLPYDHTDTYPGQLVQIVSFRTVRAYLHQTHVAAADDGNMLLFHNCNMTLFDRPKFCRFPILLFHYCLVSPVHNFVKYCIQYLTF